MLDIAENVFQQIADRLKATNFSVKKIFAKKAAILDEFEGETNVIVIQAADFLDSLKNPPLSIGELSELEVACLMRVLSKPEIDHAILLNELNLVLENFGITKLENDEVEEVEQKKQKQTKKKQIKLFIQQKDGSPEATGIYEILREVLSQFQFQVAGCMQSLKEHKYDQLVKSKKKELRVELIKKEHFFGLI